MVTNIDPILLVTNVITNIVYNLTPTNSVFNFQKTSYRVDRDEHAYWGIRPLAFMSTGWAGARRRRPRSIIA